MPSYVMAPLSIEENLLPTFDEKVASPPMDVDDVHLLENIAKGCHASFSLLVERHSQRFYALAYRMIFSKDEAEDIVQEGFLRLWQKPHLWDSSKDTRFTTWFYRIIVNLCHDHNRKKRPDTVEQDIYETVAAEADIAAENEAKQLHLHLQRAIMQLPERQRTALVLCFYEGLSNQEAATIMGLRVKALQSLIMRAKSGIKVYMTEYGLLEGETA